MIEMTLTAKGQFTFNKSLMEHLGVRAGKKVAIKKQPDGSLKITACKKLRQIKDLAGSLKSNVKLTDAELEDAIADARVAHGMRGLK